MFFPPPPPPPPPSVFTHTKQKQTKRFVCVYVVTLGFSFVDWVILGREKQEARVWKKAPVPTTTTTITTATAAAPPPPALD